MSGGDRKTVCDACFREGCWEGYFMCPDALTAGTVDLTDSELRERDQTGLALFFEQLRQEREELEALEMEP